MYGIGEQGLPPVENDLPVIKLGADDTVIGTLKKVSEQYRQKHGILLPTKPCPNWTGIGQRTSVGRVGIVYSYQEQSGNHYIRIHHVGIVENAECSKSPYNCQRSEFPPLGKNYMEWADQSYAP